jgi:RimJ/RimL family protein N-acetyltransferase
MCAALLITDRLIIQEFILDDAPFILELVNEPDWIKFIGDRKVCDLTDAKNYMVNSFFTSYTTHGFGPYLVALKENEMPIGMSCLIKREVLESVYIGYAFLKKHRGKGYAMEAVLATKNYAHEELELGALVAITNTENEASISFLKKLGFQFEKKIILPEETEEVLLFRESLNENK